MIKLKIVQTFLCVLMNQYQWCQDIACGCHLSFKLIKPRTSVTHISHVDFCVFFCNALVWWRQYRSILHDTTFQSTIQNTSPNLAMELMPRTYVHTHTHTHTKNVECTAASFHLCLMELKDKLVEKRNGNITW